MHRLSYKLLLLFTLVASIAGIATLLPRSAASYPNLIGYSSICTFAPAATFYCFFLAGLSCFIRSTFIKNQRSLGRFKAHAKSLVPLALLLVLAVGFTLRYLDIKENYTDGLSASSEHIEGEMDEE